MVKRLQVVMTEETWKIVEEATNEANKDFELGNIRFSDVINEMILCADIDILNLQNKHTNIKKSLRLMASKDLDLDVIIKNLQDIKAKKTKKRVKPTEEIVNG